MLTKMSTYIYQKTDKMFIEEFFIAAANKKLLKCPSVGEEMNKPWYINLLEYYIHSQM